MATTGSSSAPADGQCALNARVPSALDNPVAIEPVVVCGNDPLNNQSVPMVYVAAISSDSTGVPSRPVQSR